MRTAQEKPIKKEQLMDAATTLIVSRGYAATSVDDICAKAKVSKNAFFYYFKKKEHLAMALLARIAERHSSRPHLDQFGDDPLKRVLGMVDSVVEFMNERESYIGVQLTSELSDTYPEVRRISSEIHDKFVNMFVAEFKAFKDRYGASIEPRSLAMLFITVINGSQTLSRVLKNKKDVIEGLEELKRYIKNSVKK